MPTAQRPHGRHPRRRPGPVVTSLLLAGALLAVGCGSDAADQSADDPDPAGTGATSPSTAAPSTTALDPDRPPLLLGSIGFDLDYYDPATQQAGDVKFVPYNLFADEIAGVFGNDDPRSDDPAVRNPQPTFVLAAGTKVRALVDGVVVEVKAIHSGDHTVMVAPDERSPWRYETEHVIDVLVAPGDRVTAGQVVGTVSPHGSSGPGMGIVNIGILHPRNGAAGHVCPFQYLDESIRDDVHAKLAALYRAWNDYKGRQIYDVDAMVLPGCVVDTWVAG